MKKLIPVCMAFLILAFYSSAQNNELVLRKADNSFYLEHIVVAKDNFYSIGRLYNSSAKSIAALNRIDMNKGLDIGQKLRIPLSDTNFIQTGNSGTPVFYKAGLNTTLTRISDAYRKVPVENLRYWNQRTREEVLEGEKLIIGFLITKEMPSISINHTPESKPVKEEVTPVTTQPIAVSNPEEIKPAQKEEMKEQEPEKITEPVVIAEPVKEESVNDAGYFKNAFEQQLRTKPVTSQATVTSGIFKTNSGWDDGKYYLLMDKVEPGTIVKLVNPTNNKSVYAKVLGEMSGIKLNEDLDIRISNAAASVLQISDMDKFIMKVSY